MSLTVPKSLQDAQDMCGNAYSKACEYYGKAENAIVTFSKSVLPASVQPIAEKVIRAIPETIFCACMFTGAARPVAFCIWAMKSVTLITPFVTKAVKEGFSKEHMSNAYKESKARFETMAKNFMPAVLATGVAGAIISAVIGVTRGALGMVLHASLFGILAYNAYKSLNLDTPGGPGGSSSGAAAAVAVPALRTNSATLSSAAATDTAR